MAVTYFGDISASDDFDPLLKTPRTCCQDEVVAAADGAASSVKASAHFVGFPAADSRSSMEASRRSFLRSLNSVRDDLVENLLDRMKGAAHLL